MTPELLTEWLEGDPRLRVYRRPGTGPTLLLLHGVLRCAADFAPLLPLLDPAWNLVLLDHRGHGASARAGEYRVSDYCADALRLVDHLGTAGLHVYGHSLGAMVAAHIASERNVRTTVLEDPPFSSMGARIHGSSWHALFEGIRTVAHAGGPEAALLAGLKQIPMPQPGGGSLPLGVLRDEEALRWSAACLTRVDPAVLEPLVQGTWLSGWTWEGILARSRAKVILLQGDPLAGGALSAEDARTAGAQSPGCETLFFAGQGHQLHWGAAAAIARRLQRLLEESQPSPPGGSPSPGAAA